MGGSRSGRSIRCMRDRSARHSFLAIHTANCARLVSQVAKGIRESSSPWVRVGLDRFRAAPELCPNDDARLGQKLFLDHLLSTRTIFTSLELAISSQTGSTNIDAIWLWTTSRASTSCFLYSLECDVMAEFFVQNKFDAIH